jgi:hypothetical protein
MRGQPTTTASRALAAWALLRQRCVCRGAPGHASIAAITRHLKPAAASLLMEAELEACA